MIEVARELDLLVADFGHVRERAFEVCFHQVADGVELDADLVDACAVRREPCAGTCDRHTNTSHHLEKLPPCSPAHSVRLTAHAFHSSLLFMASTAYPAARAVSAM